MEVFIGYDLLMGLLRAVFRLLVLVFVCLPTALVLRFVLFVIGGISNRLRFLDRCVLQASALARNLLQRIVALVGRISPTAPPETQKRLLPAADSENALPLHNEFAIMAELNGLIADIGQDPDEDEDYLLEKLEGLVFLLNALHSRGVPLEDLKRSTTLKLKQVAPHLEFQIFEKRELPD